MEREWVSDCGTVRLICGDCLEVMDKMPAMTCNAMITDPPYCSGGFSETGKRQAAGQGLRSETIREVGWFVNDNMTTGGLVWLLRSVAVDASKLIAEGGSFCAFTDWRMVPHLAPALESSGLRYQNMVVWDKGNPGLGIGFRPSHEIVLHYVKGTGEFYDNATGNVLRVSRLNHTQKEHQTQKPVELIEGIANVVTEKGQTILDPFMGSGTTGVACVRTGRKFIGIEKEPKYFEIAKRRIIDELNRFPLLEQKQAPQQLELAGGDE